MRRGGSSGEREGASRADLIALAALTATLTLLFLDVILGASSFYIRDLAQGAYPAKKVVRDALLSGELPYWNRALGAGQPLAANPANQIFYPPTWLVLLPSYAVGFALFLLFHVYLACWGMFALLRSMRCGRPGASFGALSFTLGGALLGVHDLLPLILSLAWLPLICLFARRYLKDGGRRNFALAALFFGIQVLLAEAAVVLQTGLLLGLYAMHAGAKEGRWQPVARRLGRVAMLCVAALLLASVQILPTVDHAGDSVRSRGFPFEAVTSWSMPPARLGELVNPSFLGHQMLNGRPLYWAAGLYPQRALPFVRTIYPGILVTVLAIAAIVAAIPGRRVAISAVAISVLLAAGAHTPLWQVLYDAGLARSIRYPEKFILMGLFALTVLAARGFDLLLAREPRMERAALRTALVLMAVLAAFAALSATPAYAPLFIAAWDPPARLLSEMLAASRSGWILATARAALLFVLLRNLARVRRAVWLALAGVLVLLDLGMILPEIVPRVSRDYFGDPPLVARAHLARQSPPCRLFHVASWQSSSGAAYFRPRPDGEWLTRNALYPMLPNLWGIPTVIDRDLERTALLPTTDFADAVWSLSKRREGWLDIVAFLSNACAVALYEEPATAFARAGDDPRAVQPVRLVELPITPRYWFAEAIETVRGNEDFVEALATRDSPERTAFVRGPAFVPARGIVRSAVETANTAWVEVEAQGRAFLVMSVTPHKYWEITIDGTPAPAVVTNIGYQGVVVPAAGRHRIEMRYRNPRIAAGGGISALTMLVLALLMRR